MSGLGPDALVPILWDTLAASIDGDTARLAEATKPLFFDGDEADRYGFLCGLLAVVKAGFPCGGPAPGTFARLEIDPGADANEIAFGRLLTAYINADRDACLDLWAVIIRDEDLAAAVLALAIVQAGRVLLAGRAGEPS